MRLLFAALCACVALAMSGCNARSTLVGSWSCLADVGDMHVNMKPTYGADGKGLITVQVQMAALGKIVRATIDMNADWHMNGDLLMQKVTDMKVKSLTANGDKVDPGKGQQIFDEWVGTFANLKVIELNGDRMTLETKEAPAKCQRLTTAT